MIQLSKRAADVLNETIQVIENRKKKVRLLFDAGG
jgi:hypothetical protein